MENSNEDKKCSCKCHLSSQYIVYQIDYCCCPCVCPCYCQKFNPITTRENYATRYDYSQNNIIDISSKNSEENEKKSGNKILSENNLIKDKIKKIGAHKIQTSERAAADPYLTKRKNVLNKNYLNIKNSRSERKNNTIPVVSKNFQQLFSLNKLIPNKINTLSSSGKKARKGLIDKKSEVINNQKNGFTNNNRTFTDFDNSQNYEKKNDELYNKIKKKYGLNIKKNNQITNNNKINYSIKKDLVEENNNNCNDTNYKLEIIKLKDELSQANNIINDLKLKNNNLQKVNTDNQSKILILESKLNNIGQNKEISNTKNIGVNTMENINPINGNEKMQLLNAKISEISEKYLKLKEMSVILSKKNNEKDVIISNKNKEIDELKFRLNDLEKSGAMIMNKLDYKSNDIIKQKDLIIENYKNQNFELQNEIIQLKTILTQLEKQTNKLQVELKKNQKLDDKKLELLEMLYDFYLKIKEIINYDEKKKKIDLTLQEIVNDVSIEDFESKLLLVKKKLNRIITDFDYNKKYGFGKCFACDIACCTSHVDKLKNFRKSQSKK